MGSKLQMGLDLCAPRGPCLHLLQDKAPISFLDHQEPRASASRVGLQFLPALHPGKKLPLVGKMTSLLEEQRGISREKRVGMGRGSEGQVSGNPNKRQERRALRSDGEHDPDEIYRKAQTLSLDPR